MTQPGISVSSSYTQTSLPPADSAASSSAIRKIGPPPGLQIVSSASSSSKVGPPGPPPGLWTKKQYPENKENQEEKQENNNKKIKKNNKKKEKNLEHLYELNTKLLKEQIREVFQVRASGSQIPNGGLLFDNFPIIFESYYKSQNKTINLIGRCKAAGFTSYRAMVQTCTDVLRLTTEVVGNGKQSQVLRLVR